MCSQIYSEMICSVVIQMSKDFEFSNLFGADKGDEESSTLDMFESDGFDVFGSEVSDIFENSSLNVSEDDGFDVFGDDSFDVFGDESFDVFGDESFEVGNIKEQHSNMKEWLTANENPELINMGVTNPNDSIFFKDNSFDYSQDYSDLRFIYERFRQDLVKGEF